MPHLLFFEAEFLLESRNLDDVVSALPMRHVHFTRWEPTSMTGEGGQPRCEVKVLAINLS